MIKEGMFVRCPIDREYPYDPRIFVTGKVLSINEFNETAYIKFSDPFDQKKYFEYIIIDTGAGINSHVFDIVEQANLILIISTPDQVCIRDASLMSDEFYNRGNKSQRLIINKVSKKVIGNSLVSNLDEIIDKVGVQLIGVIPDDFKMTVATGTGNPIPADSEALRAFDAISKRLGGEFVPLTVKTS